MLETTTIGDRLKQLGFALTSGVPCSFLNDLINYAITHTRYVAAANEGDAVAIAAGAWLGGTKAVVLMQNSGLTNAVSPLTSLNAICRIPVLGFVSLRGEPGLQDEPQHELMGTITTHLLDEMRIPWEFLAAEESAALAQIERANAQIEDRQTFFFVVRKGTFAKVPLGAQAPRAAARARPERTVLPVAGPSRAEVLELLLGSRTADSVFIATTGFTGRELHDTEDLEANFYMVGSMGCASSIALGLALVRPEKSVVCLDGDGAALMRLGALATNAYYAPDNLLHVLLDNGCHESTGGQLTASSNVDWPALAAASGYPAAMHATSLAELRTKVADWRAEPRLTFLRVPTRRGTRPNLSRPSVHPAEVATRFRCHVAATVAQPALA
jgi:phosphonopyruvate decarboxylase